MVSVAPKHMAAFILGIDHALYRKYKDSHLADTNWTGWAREGGIWSHAPVTVTRVLGEVDIFMVDMNHALQQSNFNFLAGHGLGPWKNLGGKLLGPPAVANSKGTIHIFHIGTDHALYHKAWDGVSYTPEEGYERLGGAFIHAPAAVSAGEEEVSVFAIGLTDGRLYHYHWKSASGSNNYWDPAAKLPGYWTGALSVVSDKEGCWDVFGINEDEKINHISYRNGKQSGLQTVSGQFKTIDAISWGAERIDLTGLGLDSAVYHRSWDHGSWGGWENLGGLIVHRPTPVTHSSGALSVIAIAHNSTMYIKIRDPSSGIWADWVDIQGVAISRVA